MAFLKGPKDIFHLHRKGNSNGALDPAQQQMHQELERLYISTRAGKHFQKDIIKGVENFTSVGNKQLDVSNRLAEDCRKYGTDGPSVKEALSRVTLQYSSARIKMEKERESLHKSLATQVAEPLKGMVNGSPLEDARHLKQKYDRLRQDAENQHSEVQRRENKVSPPNQTEEHVVKLQAAKHKMQEITAAMDTMGRNATSSMSVVEAQQQTTTLQKMLAMVDTERTYFQRVAGILDQLHYEIEAEVQRSSISSVSRNSNGATPYPQTPSQSTPPSTTVRQMSVDPPESSYHSANGGSGYHASVDLPESYHTANGSSTYRTSDGGYEEGMGLDVVPIPEDPQSFYAIVTHDFEGEDEGELTISVGDEVLVRQVTSAGWSEGACNGQSGWFPSTYVEKKQPVRKGRGRSGSSHGSR